MESSAFHIRDPELESCLVGTILQNMIKTSHFTGTGSGLRQGDVIMVIYTTLCGLLDIDITMQCAVVESKSKSTRDQNSQNIFMIPKCFEVRQPKFRQQTNS